MEEKKLTDEVVVAKNAITDEEIVKALEICYNTPCCTNDCPYFNKNGRNFCMEGKAIYKNLEDLINRQKAEIERLTQEKEDWENSCHMWSEANKKNHLKFTKTLEKLCEERNKNAELQKQVEELTEQRNKNYLKGEIIMKDEKTLLNEIKEQCGDCKAWSGTDCTRNPYTQGCLKDEKQVIECYGMLKGCDMVKQAVKDTAKEALEAFICKLVNSRLVSTKEDLYVEMLETKDDLLKECYGVEVE